MAVDEEVTFLDKYKFPPGANILLLYQMLAAMGTFCFLLTFPLYMATIMKFSETAATTIYHAKSGMSYFLQIFGAVVSDQLLGRIHTFLYFYPLDLVTLAIITVMAVFQRFIVIIVMYFVMGVIGSIIASGMRAFIGDQIPSDKTVMLGAYLHVIYFINNLGAILASFGAPILHKDVYCFGQECYPLIFLISFSLCSSAFSVVFAGFLLKQFSICQPVTNLYGQCSSCILYALKSRISRGKYPEGHWMDYAEQKYDISLVHDCKVFLGLCLFLLGHPIFWTVFEQFSSIWTLQAQYMNGMVTDSYHVKPDQMQTINPILVLVFIPIFELMLYPFFERIHFKVPYRIALGQFFTAAACGSMIFIQYWIDVSLVVPLPSSQSNVTFFNLFNSSLRIYTNGSATEIGAWTGKSVIFKGPPTFTITVNGLNTTTSLGDSVKKYIVAAIFQENDRLTVRYGEVSIQNNSGYTNVRLFSQTATSKDEKIVLRGKFGINNNFELQKVERDFGSYIKCGVGVFDVFQKGPLRTLLGTVVLRPATSITIFVNGDRLLYVNDDFVVHSPMIYWQMLPYVLVTIGEVLFNVNTGIFLYVEAPLSMKSVMLAVQYFCIAIGNWIILIFKQALDGMSNIYLFIICSVLVLVSCGITILLGKHYLGEKILREKTLTEKMSQKTT